ncbi:MAG: response regulator [Opitutaceae bacterium]
MDSSPCILVVDDTPANIGVLIDALGDAGYQVLVAESGLSALAQLDHAKPDLILLDVMMPGLDGYETCRRIKQQPTGAHVPVIFMTALDEPGQKLRAFESGAVDYITKPIYVPEVLARTAAHLKIRQLQQDLEDELALRVDAENVLRQSLDQGVLLTDATGSIVFCTRLAEALLHRHFPAFNGRQLPAEFNDTATGLQIRRFADGDQGDLRMYVIHESRAERGPGALLALGLTSREAEVLYWIAQGKSNPDIATIISTSVRTVHKHVENIFRKLGLETRNAAALAALELLKPDSLRDA